MHKFRLNSNTNGRIITMKKLVLFLILLLTLTGCGNSREAVLIASDYEQKEENFEALASYINQDQKAQGYSIKYAVLNGDNVKTAGIDYSLKDLSNYISKNIDNLSSKNVNYVFGSHDDCADTTGTDGFRYGGHDFGKFYLYAIDFYEMTESGEAEDGIDTFWNFIDSNEKEKPIFIFSHVPMHERRGDNHGAAKWFEAINEAAEDHDIFFFWGHNHTNESGLDDSLDFKSPGHELKIEGLEGEREINFYYINSGYIIKGISIIMIFEADGSVTYRPLYLEKNGFDENIVEHCELEHN